MSYEAIERKYKLEHLEDLLQQTDDFILSLIEDKKLKDDGSYPVYLLYSLGKCIVSTREVMCLCKSGYPDGALSIARGIYEQLIVTVYFEYMSEDKNKFDALLKRYHDDYDLKLLDAKSYYAENVIPNFEDLKSYHQQIKTIKNRYSIKSMNAYWWTGGKFSSITKLENFTIKQAGEISPPFHLMHYLYMIACNSMHASNLGNRTRLGGDMNCIAMGPWDKGQEASLFLATGSLIYITGCIAHYFDISIDDIMNELNSLWLFYCDIVMAPSKYHANGEYQE